MAVKIDENRPLPARHEAFAVHVASGSTLADAYRMAGYAATGDSVYEAASRLAKQSRVQSRIAQVQSRFEEARVQAQLSTMIVTANTVSSMLADAFEQAKKHRQIGAQVAAAMGLAKLHGLLVDKTEDVTRKATRNPDAPIEIDVEHWVTEQSALLLGQSPAGDGAQTSAPPDVEPQSQSPDDMGLGAPEPRSPETQVSE